MNLFVQIARKIALARHRSKSVHNICPLSQCRISLVLLDGSKSGLQECSDSVEKFFRERNIQCRIFVINTQKDAAPVTISGAKTLTIKNVNWFGRVRRSKKSPKVIGDEDILINLLPLDNFTAYYISVCSPAKFKIGIYDTSDHINDLSISNTDGFSQGQIFNQISNIIKSII